MWYFSGVTSSAATNRRSSPSGWMSLKKPKFAAESRTSTGTSVGLPVTLAPVADRSSMICLRNAQSWFHHCAQADCGTANAAHKTTRQNLIPRMARRLYKGVLKARGQTAVPGRARRGTVVFAPSFTFSLRGCAPSAARALAVAVFVAGGARRLAVVARLAEARDEHVEEAERLVRERRCRLFVFSAGHDGLRRRIRSTTRDGADARQRSTESTRVDGNTDGHAADGDVVGT